MNNQSSLLFFVLVFILTGCAVFSPQKKEENTFSNKLTYMTGDSTSYRIKEVKNLVGLAQNSLSINDNIGALAYYENAYVRFMEISLEKREELLQDSIFTGYFEENLQQPYDLLKNSFSFFEEDTTSTDEVQMELENYMVADTPSEDTTKIEEEEGLEIPEVINNKVKSAIKYFTTTTRGRRVMNRWLQRTTKYEKMIKGILKEEGAPTDLFYLSLIESGLNPRAKSYASAVGPWQFISRTGRAYGLNHSFWYDERSDFVKASHAAGRHLLDLYKSFGNWYYAMAGYNYSPRRLKSRIRRSNADNFWEVKRLPRQTRNYIPSFLAVRHISKNYKAYGFVVDSLPAFTYDTVTVSESIDLSVIAGMVDTTYKAIRYLNPAVKRWVTPPDVKNWVLYLPEGKREQFVEAYKKIPESQKRHYVRHKVRSGQTLSHISYRYGVPIWLIKKYNKINRNLIRVGQNLIIPVPANKKAYYASIKQKPIKQSYKKRSNSKTKPVVKGKKVYVYKVKNGDNLFDISQKFGVSVSRLRYWNNLDYARYIYPGQSLNVWLPEEMVNNLRDKDPSFVVAAVTKKESGTEAVVRVGVDGEHIIHKVRYGDTLWDIAQKYNTSIRNIKKWNSKRSNKIKPGEKLIIYK